MTTKEEAEKSLEREAIKLVLKRIINNPQLLNFSVSSSNSGFVVNIEHTKFDVVSEKQGRIEMKMDCAKDSKGVLHCVFHYDNSAYTLHPTDIGKHENGWKLKAEIHEDYFEWVNYFEASHPVYGKVWGDFESEVEADSYTAMGNFLDNFEPHEWDYADI